MFVLTGNARTVPLTLRLLILTIAITASARISYLQGLSFSVSLCPVSKAQI